MSYGRRCHREPAMDASARDRDGCALCSSIITVAIITTPPLIGQVNAGVYSGNCINNEEESK
ncbi:MAG: hypothetical protein AUJ92_14955 [Armatimonadetes bacterium CG2_30_59_28]|nr:MAG: hypothetical protein AUJ92_14955 [Armatimonadetes bacterium CG2_30_59_28]PIU60382.1 MAG: hypothetical protein COS85_24880 [Armatimonadetes bacterium CG07_land_8_20_14_0_80_59_28]PIX38775.1 MAG: hypothetical protein COZ56_19645 [Armatimonadetes bacterium CG_4_8_14_3_um_filter_58_9]PIY49208.1 MAG: hypothetical protein COZ05_00920 [Armatimonadetes bacterium CG_4_10_14_3_um_filter_59_10]